MYVKGTVHPKIENPIIISSPQKSGEVFFSPQNVSGASQGCSVLKDWTGTCIKMGKNNLLPYSSAGGIQSQRALRSHID